MNYKDFESVCKWLRDEQVSLDLNEAEMRQEWSLFKNENKAFSITAVSHRRELYFAFMEEYNALMGEGEQEILKEEVEVLLAKYSG